MSLDRLSQLADRLRGLLDQLLPTHSPSGREEEMDEVCIRLLGRVAEQVEQDDQGNIIARLSAGRGPAIGIFAHKDEIALMVSRIHEDGKMEVEPLGGGYPWTFGEGPWEVLGEQTALGVLAVGSRHVSERSGELHEVKQHKPLTWKMMRLDCKLSPDELAQRGISVGCLACVARSRKMPVYIGDYVAGYALDDKAGVAALILLAELLAEEQPAVQCDVYLVLTGMEEIGTIGAGRVANSLELSAVIAVDVVPVAPEYPIEPGPAPAVVFKDAYSVYSPELSRQLAGAAEEVAGAVQPVVVRSYGSDASGILRRGLAGRAALLGFATENTHGYEVAHLHGIANCALALSRFCQTYREETANE